MPRLPRRLRRRLEQRADRREHDADPGPRRSRLHRASHRAASPWRGHGADLRHGPRWNPRTHELRLIERLADVRLPRRISGAAADLLVERRDALPDRRARGGGLPFERDREETDRLRQAIDLLVRVPELARETRASRGGQADVRQRSAAGKNRLDGLDRIRRLPAASSARNSGTLKPAPAGSAATRREQQVDAGRWLGRALRRGEPRRHEHRPIGGGRRQVGHRAQPIDFRLRRRPRRPPADANARAASTRTA